MTNKDKLTGALLGAIAGVITGILLAPKSGKETRTELETKYEGIRDDLSQKIHNVKKITQETYDDVVDEVVSNYENQKKIGVDEGRELRKSLKEGYERIKEKMKE